MREGRRSVPFSPFAYMSRRNFGGEMLVAVVSAGAVLPTSTVIDESTAFIFGYAARTSSV